MTIIYSVENDTKGNEIIAKPKINKEQVVTKQSLSNRQVVVKLSLSLPNIGELLRKELLPRCKVKIYEGPNTEYKLINEQHLLYSNIFNMKDEGDGLGLAMMRDISSIILLIKISVTSNQLWTEWNRLIAIPTARKRTDKTRWCIKPPEQYEVFRVADEDSEHYQGDGGLMASFSRVIILKEWAYL